MNDILLLRHGETQHTGAHRFDANLDTPLTENGLRQAQAFANLARDTRRVGKIVASTMRRAWETADVIGKSLSLSRVVDQRLNEIAYTLMNGRNVSQMMAEEPEFWRRFVMAPSAGSIPGWESIHSVQARAWEAIEEARLSSDGDLLVVTHSMTLFAILSKVLEVDLARMLDLPYSKYCDFFHLPCEYAVIAAMGSEVRVTNMKGRDHLSVPVPMPTQPILPEVTHDSSIAATLCSVVGIANQEPRAFEAYFPEGFSFALQVPNETDRFLIRLTQGAYRVERVGGSVNVPSFSFRCKETAFEFIANRLPLLDEPAPQNVEVDASVAGVMKAEMFFRLANRFTKR